MVGGMPVVDGPDAGYKVGIPYDIRGITYYPEVDYSYDETGIASWYGPGFHGRPTAIGERFDQNAISAAHPTLPLPSIVEVINLDNGRSLFVRVNDRGPFADGRIIDMSRAAAEELGFRIAGTARVRVRIVERESRILAGDLAPDAPPPQIAENDPDLEQIVQAGAGGGAATASPLSLAPPGREPALLPAGASIAMRPAATAGSRATVRLISTAADGGWYVQAGAFNDPRNAAEAQDRLAPLGDSRIVPVQIGETAFWRVRLGPTADPAAAGRLLARVIDAGYPGARVVTD